MDGQPIAEASVSFVRDDAEGGRAAAGGTDNDGVATLTTFRRNDGVLPGDYRVVVYKLPAGAPVLRDPPTSEMTDEQKMRKMVNSSSMGASARRAYAYRRSLLPEVYSDPGTTPLTCTVEPGKLEHRFELSSTP